MLTLFLFFSFHSSSLTWSDLGQRTINYIPNQYSEFSQDHCSGSPYLPACHRKERDIASGPPLPPEGPGGPEPGKGGLEDSGHLGGGGQELGAPVHGTDDRILPFEATAARLPELIDDIELLAVDGGPHNIAWTHPDEVNEALLEFIGASAPVAA